MGIIRTILLVVFIIISILLILLVLVQNDDSNGMGSAFGGQSAAFGSHSASVLTKTTGVLVGLFFVTVFSLALLSRTNKADAGLSETAASVETAAPDAESASGTANTWLEEEIQGTKAELPQQTVDSAVESVENAVEATSEAASDSVDAE